MEILLVDGVFGGDFACIVDAVDGASYRVELRVEPAMNKSSMEVVVEKLGTEPFENGTVTDDLDALNQPFQMFYSLRFTHCDTPYD